MSDRGKSVRDNLIWWPASRSSRDGGKVANRVVGRRAAPPSAATEPGARLADDSELTFSVEGGLAPNRKRGYNPYDHKPRPNDTLPWTPRRR